MNAIIRATAVDLAAKIKSRELSSVEVTRAHLQRIEEVDPAVHAFLHIDTERAMHAAMRIDAKIANGEQVGPLAGVPLALKDVLTYAGAPTTCGSKILAGWIPPYDATVTQRLLDADLVILGKTNMDEFAMGSSTENSAYGPTHNPWALDRFRRFRRRLGRLAGRVRGAVGDRHDTGGSIRQPAAVTGTSASSRPTVARLVTGSWRWPRV